MTGAVGDPGPSFLDSLGDRGRRRAEPRTSVSLAGAGCALAILGVLILAGDSGFDDNTGEFATLPGILLSGLLVAAGYFMLAAIRQGALATAGVVAASLGVPACMFFLTFDENSLPPYNAEAILVVSSAVWLGSYLFGPGSGRPFFLGAGLIGVWFTVLELTENVFEFPVDPLGWLFFGFTVQESFEATGDVIDPSTGEIIDTGSDFGTTGGFEQPSIDTPDLTTIGILSLLFGVGFLLAARWLDRGGRHGSATPFVFAALPCLVVGVIGLAPDLEAAGTGLVLIAIGLALSYNGATTWRRATSWIGGATTAIGLALFLGDMADDQSVATFSMLYIAGGIGLVFLGHLIASAIGEPDELAVTLGAAAVATPSRVLVADAAPSDDPDAQWKPPIPPPPDLPPPPPPA